MSFDQLLSPKAIQMRKATAKLIDDNYDEIITKILLLATRKCPCGHDLQRSTGASTQARFRYL